MSITDAAAAAAAQTPMTVYYRQFQTSYAHGLNIAQMEIAGRFHSYDDDGRVGVCAPERSFSDFMLYYTVRVCVLFSQRDN